MGEYVGALVVMLIVAVVGVAVANASWDSFATAFANQATGLINTIGGELTFPAEGTG